MNINSVWYSSCRRKEDPQRQRQGQRRLLSARLLTRLGRYRQAPSPALLTAWFQQQAHADSTTAFRYINIDDTAYIDVCCFLRVCLGEDVPVDMNSCACVWTAMTAGVSAKWASRILHYVLSFNVHWWIMSGQASLARIRTSSSNRRLARTPKSSSLQTSPRHRSQSTMSPSSSTVVSRRRRLMIHIRNWAIWSLLSSRR